MIVQLGQVSVWIGSTNITWKDTAHSHSKRLRGTLHLLNVQTRIQDRAECGEGTELHLGGGGDTALKNIHHWEHCTYFLDGGEQLGWGHHTTLKHKLELSRFSILLRIKDRGDGDITHTFLVGRTIGVGKTHLL